MKGAELQQKDQHKQWELAEPAPDRRDAGAQRGGEQQSDMAVQGQKMQESREAHQANMREPAEDANRRSRRRRRYMAQAHQNKQQDMAAQQPTSGRWRASSKKRNRHRRRLG